MKKFYKGEGGISLLLGIGFIALAIYGGYVLGSNNSGNLKKTSTNEDFKPLKISNVTEMVSGAEKEPMSLSFQRKQECVLEKTEFEKQNLYRKKERESYGVFNNSYITKEIFYSNKINSCVAVVEIVNDYHFPSQRRMYAYDIVKKEDLFSTDTYECNYKNNCGNPVYSSERNNFYNKVGALGGKIESLDIVMPQKSLKENTVTIFNKTYGTIQTFEFNKQDSSVLRNDTPGFAYNPDYTKNFTDCTVVNIGLWRCGVWDEDTFGVKDGKYFWYVLGRDYGEGFRVLE